MNDIEIQVKNDGDYLCRQAQNSLEGRKQEIFGRLYG